MKRLGILGGSFNPIHFGHLIMAQYALEALKLDQVVFMPTCITPLKDPKTLVPAAKRLAMVKLALKGLKNFKTSDIEVKRKKSSYTVETLRQLRTIHKGAELYWIIGEDALKDLPRWKEIAEIGKMASFIVLNRPRMKVKAPKVPVTLRFVDMPPIGISSTEMRSRLKGGKPVDFMTPAGVVSYISKNKLYRK